MGVGSRPIPRTRRLQSESHAGYISLLYLTIGSNQARQQAQQNDRHFGNGSWGWQLQTHVTAPLVPRYRKMIRQLALPRLGVFKLHAAPPAPGGRQGCLGGRVRSHSRFAPCHSAALYRIYKHITNSPFCEARLRLTPTRRAPGFSGGCVESVWWMARASSEAAGCRRPRPPTRRRHEPNTHDKETKTQLTDYFSRKSCAAVHCAPPPASVLWKRISILR